MPTRAEVLEAIESVPADDGVIVVEWLGWEKGCRKLAFRAPAKADPARRDPAACMIVFGGPTRPSVTISPAAPGVIRDGGW